MGERRIALVVTVLILTAASAGRQSTHAAAGRSSQPASGPKESTPVHTIKITLREEKGGGACQASISPERAGFYEKDNVIWNVENGCKMNATVTIGEVVRLEPGASQPAAPFTAGENWSNTRTVPPKERRQITVQVRQAAPYGRYRYSVALKIGAQGDDPNGEFDICKQPPCPPYDW